MAWIEVHQALPTHRKTLAVCDELGIEPAQAVGHLVCFWLWALDNAPDGDLGDVTNKTIARAAGWRKNADTFADALRKAGLLDGSTIHNWNDYAGRLVEKRAANRDRMRSARAARERPPQPPTDTPRAAHVQRTNDARAGATQPNLTQPNHKESDDSLERVPAPKPGKKARTLITDEQIEALVTEFAERFGSPLDAREDIAAALNHTARLTKLDEYLYVKQWLRGTLERRAQRGNVVSMNGQAHPPLGRVMGANRHV